LISTTTGNPLAENNSGMHRRIWLKNFGLLGAGLALLPSCTWRESDTDILADLTEALIPETDTPGARKLAIHDFVARMIRDCHAPDDYTVLQDGLIEIQQLSKHLYKRSFSNITAAEQVALLEKLEKLEEDTVARKAYRMIRHRSIQGYLNSEYVTKELLPYELIPKPFNGSAPVV
jgi:hypothetical protein